MERKPTIAIFFCQQIDPEQDVNRRALEKEMGPRIRFFPLPCSGRIEALHLLRALEAGADKVYLVTCQHGACRYEEGNARARKRVLFAQQLIEEIGLERERIELVAGPSVALGSINEITRHLISKETLLLPSPLHGEELNRAGAPLSRVA